MFHYPLRYRISDCVFELLFFGIVNENPKPNKSMFVKWAFPIQMLKMICIAGLLAAVSCFFAPLETALTTWMIASFFLLLIGTAVFTAY